MLAVLVLAFLFVAACTQSEEVIPDYSLGEDGKIDFDGLTFKITDIVHHGDTPLIPTYGENALDDTLLEHYEKVENEINCNIELFVGDTAAFRLNIMSGNHYTDIMNDYYSSIFNNFKSGFAYDYNDIEDIDLHSGKYGTQNLLDSLTWGSGTYGVVAEYWGIPTPYFADAFLYNPRIIREYGQTSPYEYYENGEWNWENFETIAQAVTDLTSNPDKPIYASCFNGYFTRAAFFSNGATIVRQTEDGTLVFNLPSDEATEAAEWLQKLINQYQVLDMTSYTWDVYCDMFIKGQYAFLAEYSWVGLSKDNGRVGLYMEEEFSWIPFPRGPKGSDEVLATYAGSNFALFIPVNAAVYDIGLFMETLLEPLYENDYGWRENFKREVFWNDESYEVYIKMLDSAVSDYTMLTSNSSPLTAFSAVVNGTKSITQAYEEIAEKAQTQLDNEYNKYLDQD